MYILPTRHSMQLPVSSQK